MTSLLGRGLLRSRFVALLTLGLSAVVVGATPPPVQANTAIMGQADRLAISLEVGGFDNVQTDPAILASAPSNSLEGKLFVYKNARRALVASVVDQNAAYTHFDRLQNMSEAEISEAYPAGDYKAAVADAVYIYNGLQAQAVADQIAADQALNVLSEGRPLSHDAMLELHLLLDL